MATYLWVFRKKQRRSKFRHSLTYLAATSRGFFLQKIQGNARSLTAAYLRRQIDKVCLRKVLVCNRRPPGTFHVSSSKRVHGTQVNVYRVRVWVRCCNRSGLFVPGRHKSRIVGDTTTPHTTPSNYGVRRHSKMYSGVHTTVLVSERVPQCGIQRSLQDWRVYGGYLGIKKRWRTCYGCDKFRRGAK